MTDPRAVLRRIDAARQALNDAMTSRPLLVGLALFAIACATRLPLVTTSRFTGDEIVFWHAATGIANGTEFPLLGPSITGGGARHPGPLFYYVMAIPLLISKAPEACNAFVALLSAVSVTIYWSSLRPFFGEVGAAFAALLMACMPWSTLYADRIWNPNVIGFFVALAFWSACKLRKEPAWWQVALMFASCAAMPQFHMSSPMVWLALIPIFLPALPKWRWWWPLVGLAAATTLYIPMLIHEHRTHWENARLFLAESSSNTSEDWKRVPSWAFRLLTLDVSYHQLHSYWGQHTEKEMLDFVRDGNSDFKFSFVRHAALWLSAAFAAFAIVFATWRAFWRVPLRGPRPFFWAALVGLVANTALLGLAHKPVYGHYVQSLIPFYFAAFAAVGRSMAKWPIGAWLGGVLVTLLVCIGGVDSAQWVSNRLDARNGLGTMRRVIRAIEHDDPAPTAASLQFGYIGWDSGFREVLGLEKDHKLQIGYGSAMYMLVLNDTLGPSGARLVMRASPIALYRVR